MNYVIIILFYLPWIHNLIFTYQKGGARWMGSPSVFDGYIVILKFFGILNSEILELLNIRYIGIFNFLNVQIMFSLIFLGFIFILIIIIINKIE